MDIAEFNRNAWDQQVENGNCWTVPVTPEQTQQARLGNFELLLTPTIAVPRDWLGEVRGKDILLLASGGGQQGPLLAAAGARVTVYDNSPRQLARDREVAARDGLEIETILGDMRDLSALASERFDLVFHPVSNCFVDVILPVWREAYRVLRHGGALLAGFNNPALYLFDQEEIQKQGVYKVANRLPYADIDALDEETRTRLFGANSPLEWSHTLDEQIGGQLAAGFLLAGFYEDTQPGDPLSEFMPCYIATRALKF
jgi:SAM-dependent methyltransferase